MYAQKKIFALFVVSLASFFASFAETHAATVTASSCSSADVSTAITSASAGATVTIPAGSCAWSNNLTITKGINLIGAGIGKTVITASNGAFSYQPADRTLNTPFRVSGFTLSLGGGTGVLIRLGPPAPYQPSPDQTKIRIDHNRFTNGAPSNTTAHAMWIYGGMYGVADNNTFDNIYYPMNHDAFLSGTQYGGQWSWNTWHLTYGEPDNNLYFEDNIITLPADGNGQTNLSQCQFSGRYAYRYNTITQNGDGQPMFDAHGNNGGTTADQNTMWSCFGGEIYGNQINTGGYNGQFVNQRGGEMAAFYNNFNGGGMAFTPTEEYTDTAVPATPEPMHVHNSYYWNNRINLSGSVIGAPITKQLNYANEPLPVPSQNQDFWTDNKDKGAPGVFCGTLSNRPASCAIGQGYWATNQSCTDLTGLVGDINTNPSRKTISGTLYKCTAANTWTSSYQPYTYPHPLRAETGTNILQPPYLYPPSN